MFKNMWTLSLMKFIYVIGVIAIIVFSVLLWQESPLSGFLAFMGLNIAWRLITEGIVLIFSIHERLTEILNELRDDKETEDFLDRYPEPEKKSENKEE